MKTYHLVFETHMELDGMDMHGPDWKMLFRIPSQFSGSNVYSFRPCTAACCYSPWPNGEDGEVGKTMASKQVFSTKFREVRPRL